MTAALFPSLVTDSGWPSRLPVPEKAPNTSKVASSASRRALFISRFFTLAVPPAFISGLTFPAESTGITTSTVSLGTQPVQLPGSNQSLVLPSQVTGPEPLTVIWIGAEVPGLFWLQASEDVTVTVTSCPDCWRVGVKV